MDLPGKHRPIKRPAEIINNHVVDDIDAAGLRVDLDLGHVGAVGVCRLGGRERILTDKLLGMGPARQFGERDGPVGSGDVASIISSSLGSTWTYPEDRCPGWGGARPRVCI